MLRVVPVHEGFHQDDTGLGTGVNHLPGIGNRARKGLLAQDVLACLGSLDGLQDQSVPGRNPIADCRELLPGLHPAPRSE
ncbi:MAG: hypothetical protein EB020_10960 [Proteobacteria bacterium]|nr:hypothetical protein [Pseudomonadota bacterium]